MAITTWKLNRDEQLNWLLELNTKEAILKAETTEVIDTTLEEESILEFGSILEKEEPNNEINNENYNKNDNNYYKYYNIFITIKIVITKKIFKHILYKYIQYIYL